MDKGLSVFDLEFCIGVDQKNQGQSVLEGMDD